MITDEARTLYRHMAADLLAFFEAEGKYLEQTQLFVEVSLRFGKQMLSTVCPALNMDVGECSVGAIEVMKELAEAKAAQKENPT